MGLTQTYRQVSNSLEQADWLIPTLARLLFAAILSVYFLNAGLTKVGTGVSGLWTPTAGAYAQIFPRAFEAAGYDADALGLYYRIVAVLGTWAEFILPGLIVLGLLTRLAAMGMIIFVLVQSATDYFGHGLTAALGAWFDRFPDAALLDQRALWLFPLLVLVIKGAGPISFDRAIRPGGYS